MELNNLILNEIIEYIKKQPLAKKYLSKNAWLSGSSTVVSPIMIFPSEMILQWESDNNRFNLFISRIITRFNNIFEDGYFWKSDGSCPSQIILKFKESASNGTS